MITITMNRKKSAGYVCPPYVRKESTAVAMSVLLKCSLEFGAEITEASETKLVTFTRCMGCEDTDTFEGPAEEMLSLLQAAHFYLLACQQENVVMAAAMQQLDALPGNTGRTPRYLDFAWPMVAGENRVKLALLLAMKACQDDITTGMSMRLGDVEAAIALMVGSDMSFSDVLAAAAPPPVATAPAAAELVA